MTPRPLVLLIVGVLAATAACDGDPEADASSAPFLTPSDAATASPTTPAQPQEPPPTEGSPSAGCVEGWVTPEPGSMLARLPLRVLRTALRQPGPYEVVDMRYFVGPESPPSDKGYLKEVERWYLKLFVVDDLRFQGRFIVESRRFGDGLVAVAPYDTTGFRSPDWVGFQWNAADTQPKGYPRLPGEWRGVPYDFVRGGHGLQIPGLPDEVIGCLEGT